jgi:hypothetical protein
MLKAKYKVHSAVQEDIAVRVMINDKSTVVKVPGLIVEMTNEFESHTYRFVPEDMLAALAMYVPGADMTVEINAAE